MNNLLEPNTTWLVIRKRAYKMAGFDTDYRVEKETKNKGKADQYKHSLEMLNEEKEVSREDKIKARLLYNQQQTTQ